MTWQPYPEGDPYRPPFGTLNHYYGDAVRMLFVAVAIMTGIAIPFSGELRMGALIGAPSIVVLLILAGLTNPHGKVVLALNALVAGVGVVFTQLIALAAFGASGYPFFAFMECMSVLLMTALYLSIKNVRAMAAHKIGKVDGAGEFEETNR
ncbi:MAG: hypothetical protein ACYCZ0_00925 [Minisyncoccota bacterium]